MRPKAVVLAEQLYWASILVLIVGTVLTWQAAAAVLGAGVAAGSAMVVVGLSALLLILTTRKRSRVALWLLTAWTAFSAWGVLRQVTSGTMAGTNGVLQLVQLFLMVLAIVLLFRPRARHWFAGDRVAQMEDL